MIHIGKFELETARIRFKNSTGAVPTTDALTLHCLVGKTMHFDEQEALEAT